MVQTMTSEKDLIPRVIKKIWSLLGHSGDHVQIVQLLKQFDRLKPEIFSDVIMNDLDNDDRDMKLEAVKKFATFWKIALFSREDDSSDEESDDESETAFKKQKNEKYIPF